MHSTTQPTSAPWILHPSSVLLTECIRCPLKLPLISFRISSSRLLSFSFSPPSDFFFFSLENLPPALPKTQAPKTNLPLCPLSHFNLTHSLQKIIFSCFHFSFPDPFLSIPLFLLSSSASHYLLSFPQPATWLPYLPAAFRLIWPPPISLIPQVIRRRKIIKILHSQGVHTNTTYVCKTLHLIKFIKLLL